MSLASLHRLSLLIGSSLQRERECAAFMGWLRSEVGPRRAALFVAAPGRENLFPAAVSGFRKPPRGVLPAGHDPWNWLEAQKMSLPRGERYALPILLEGELFGLLAVISAKKGEALSEEQRLLDLALAYLAPILRNIEHYENVERTVEERTAQLRQSEERFRTLAETTSTAIFVYSGEKFIYVNHATEELTGYTAEELLAMRFWDVVHPDFREMIRQRGLARQRGEQVPSRYEVKIVRKDGGERWLDFTAGKIEWQGQPAAIGSAFDITERKRAEEALRASENLLAEAQRIGKLGHAEWVAGKDEIICSEETLRIFELPRDGRPITKKMLGERIHPEDRQRLVELDRQFFAARADLEYEYRLLLPANRQRWVHQHAKVTYDERGAPIRVVTVFQDITERKMAEEALREQEERFRAYIERASDYIFALDPQGNFTFVNAAMCAALGCREQDLLGKPALTVVAPEARQEAVQVLQRIWDGETVDYMDLPVQTRDGKTLVVQIRGRAFYRDGQLVETLHIARDITLQKQAEEALKESEEKFKTLFHSANDAIFLMNHTTFLDCNATTEKIFQCSRDQIVGRSPVDFSPEYQPDGRLSSESAAEKIEAAFAGKPQFFEWMHTHLDGTPFHAEVSLNRVFVGGEFILQAIVRDISERKQAEEALRAGEEKYRTLIEQLPAIVYVDKLDRKGTTLFISPQVKTILGISVEDWMKGDNSLWLNIIHPEDRRRALDAYQGLVESGQPYEIEYRALSREGRWIWLHDTGNTLRGSDGELLLHGVMFDITARKHHERQLEAQAMLARALGESLELQPLLERLLEAARHAIPAAEKGSISLMDGEQLQLRAVSGYHDDSVLNFVYPITWGYAGRAARERQPLLVKDVQADQPLQADAKSAPMREVGELRSAIAAPLLIQERVIGVLSLDSTRKDAFTPEDLNHLVGFAASAALVIENARLFEEQTRLAKRLQMLHFVSQEVIRRARTPEQVYEAVYQAACQLMSADNFTIALHDEARGEFEGVYLIDEGQRYPPVRASVQEGISGFVIRTGKTLRIGDVKKESAPAPVHYGSERASRAYLCVPLRIGEKVIGAMSMQSYQPNAYQPEDEALLEMLASYAAAAIQNARLFEETRRRAEETASLLEASLSLSSLNLQETLQTIGERARHLFAADGCRIFLLEPDGKTLRCVLALAESEVAFADLTIPLGYGVTGHVALTGEAEIVNDMLNDPRAQTVPGTEQEAEALMFAPLKSGQKTIGVISIRRVGSERPFQPNDLDLLKAFASLAASAVSNARLFEEIQARLQELEILQTLSTSLRQARAVEEMLPLFIQYAARAVDAAAGSIYLWEEASGEWVSHGWMTADGHWQTDTADLRHRPGEGVTGWVGERGEIYITTDWRADPTNQPLPHEVEFMQRLSGGISLPLKTEEQVIGIMHLWYEGKHDFDEREKRLLIAIADIAANAIQRARLHDETTQQLKRLTALRDIDRAIASSFDLNLVFTFLLNGILSQLKADAADILLFEPHTNTLYQAAKRGFRSTRLSNVHLRLDESLAGRAALERTLVAIPNLYEAAEGFSIPEFLEGENFKAYYAYPLVAKGELKGVLEVFHRAPLFVTSNWLDFFETLAGQAAIAIDNARLFENLERSNLELMLAYDETIEGWSRALDLRDKETEGHTRRVTELTLKLAAQLGIPPADMAHIRRGALLHDIGKVGVPDSILLKPAPLTDEEQRIMRRHPQFAYDMLAPIQYLRPALDIPYCHHEKWDGTGYPRGLKGEEIPLPARIFAVADVYDALTSDRPYRKAWTKEEALEYIRQQSGSHFDPRVTAAFLSLIESEE